MKGQLITKSWKPEMAKVIEYMIENPFYHIGQMSESTGINRTTLRRWLNSPVMMDKYHEAVKEHWAEAAFKSKIKMEELADKGDRQACEFILKCNGENPQQNVSLTNDGEIKVTIGL